MLIFIIVIPKVGQWCPPPGLAFPAKWLLAISRQQEAGEDQLLPSLQCAKQVIERYRAGQRPVCDVRFWASLQ
ncbi:hypothetical protein [Bosea sp. BE168]|uniref:hypothetical protein n=1 Tax=Bosea sp. BE168 TaxID=2817907 RepID=UPI00286CCE69|nr:hypothetical protein [Bosea sp. BE168]